MKYQYPTDNAARSATSIGVNTGSEDATYPSANLADGDLYLPAKLTTTTGSWVVSFSSAQRVDWVALGPHNLTPGLEVRIQGNATNSWGSPTLNTTITIPSDWADGNTATPWRDLTGVTGYTTSGFQYWRLVVVGTNAAPVAVSELWLSRLDRSLVKNIRWGWSWTANHPKIRHETELGVVSVYAFGTRSRSFKAEVTTTDTGMDDLMAWFSACYDGGAMVVVPDETKNDAWFVRFLTDSLSVTREYTDYNRINFELEELVAGPPL